MRIILATITFIMLATPSWGVEVLCDFTNTPTYDIHNGTLINTDDTGSEDNGIVLYFLDPNNQPYVVETYDDTINEEKEIFDNLNWVSKGYAFSGAGSFEHNGITIIFNVLQTIDNTSMTLSYVDNISGEILATHFTLVPCKAVVID